MLTDQKLALMALDSTNVTELHQQLGAIAATYQTYIGATYLRFVNDSKTTVEGL